MLQNHRCEDIAQVAERFQLYNLVRQYFHNNGLTEQQIADFLAVASQVTGDSQEIAEGICLLQHARQYPESEAEYEYNTLFVGPGKLLAPPFESSYRNAERTLMQQETMAVRAFYTRLGLACERLNSTPDDHLATELEFVCYLHAKAGRFLEKEMTDHACLFLELYREFFNAHLKHWIAAHCQDVLRQARTSLCRGMALIMLGFFRQEEQRLELSKEGFPWIINTPTQDEHLLKGQQDQLRQ